VIGIKAGLKTRYRHPEPLRPGSGMCDEWMLSSIRSIGGEEAGLGIIIYDPGREIY
jgi:hypothetical protein